MSITNLPNNPMNPVMKHSMAILMIGSDLLSIHPTPFQYPRKTKPHQSPIRSRAGMGGSRMLGTALMSSIATVPARLPHGYWLAATRFLMTQLRLGGRGITRCTLRELTSRYVQVFVAVSSVNPHKLYPTPGRTL